MANFDAQITDLVGGTIDQTACDQWAADACKEIIHQLPENLKAKCATVTPLNDSTSTMDLDGIGEILSVTRLSANSGGYQIPCREIPFMFGDRANDSTDLNYYGTATDPVFWIISNSSDASTLFVKPTPTSSQTANVYHITYPSVDVSGVSTIANFPDEAEYLVVLFAASKQILQYQSTMTTSFNSDIGTAYTASNTELDETQLICDKVDADLVLAKAEIVLAKAEAAEIAALTDTASGSSDLQTALGAITTELNKVDNIIVEASTEFDKVDNVIVEGSTEIDKSTALLDLGETDSETTVNNAAAKIITELDDARGVCDNIAVNLNNSVTALSNMATEIALANAEVDGVTTTMAQALALTDSNSTDIATALDGMQTAVAKFRADASDPALFGDESTYLTASSAMTKVKDAVDDAKSLIGLATEGDKYHADYDLEAIMSDIDVQITEEDTELAASRIQQAQTQMNAMSSHLSLAQMHITEWNTTVQTLVSEINAFASEAQARYGWINAKAAAWQGKLSAAQGYMSTANGYQAQANGFNSTAQGFANEVQSRIALANGYIAEINIRLAQANTKRQESQSRLTAGTTYLQEANAIVSNGNAYLQEAQGYIAQANGYANKVGTIGGAASSKMQAIQGHINTAQAYVSTAQGFGSEVQTKIGISSGYIAEANARLQSDSAKYQWYSDQYVKLSTEYQKGLQSLTGRKIANDS